MLSDTMIRYLISHESEAHRLVVDPVPEDVQFQPASLDLRLGPGFRVYKTPLRGALGVMPLDPRTAHPMEWLEGNDDASFIVEPGAFVLGTTVERVRIPRQIVARVEGKSSLGRLGLIVHATAGFIDPGFEGNITLEMYNLAPRPILLSAGMRICQLSFDKVEGTVERPYGHPALKSKYQGQTGVTPSRAGTEE